METKFLKSASAEALKSGEQLSLGMNRIKDGKYYEFSARFDGALGENNVIFLCHGHMISYGRWLEITEKELKICNYTSWAAVPLSEKVFEHGLNIKNFIKISIMYDTASAQKQICLQTDGGEYVMGAGHWSCCDGEIMVKAEGVELRDVFLGFNAFGYDHDIWVIGASYLSLGDPARWPFYWFADNGAGPLLTGRGGMGAQHGMEDFTDALKYGTPKILVWDSVSGNNPDSEEEMSPVFYENTLEMLKICKEKGIKVYIQTMPNCPARTNMYKNDVIINKKLGFADYDYEVIDLARSLDARDQKHPSWFENMLYTDNVHPTRLGGRASYLSIICDCPELIVGSKCEVYSSSDAALVDIPSGGKLTLSAPKERKDRVALTFRADFEGALPGSVILGSETGSKLVIDSEKLKVYLAEELVSEVDNPAVMSKLLNVRIDLDGGEAKISLMSSGERNYDPAKTTLDTLTLPWSFGGEIFAKADGVDLTDARIKLVTV